jgi:hypothetical protein
VSETDAPVVKFDELEQQQQQRRQLEQARKASRHRPFNPHVCRVSLGRKAVSRGGGERLAESGGIGAVGVFVTAVGHFADEA